MKTGTEKDLTQKNHLFVHNENAAQWSPLPQKKGRKVAVPSLGLREMQGSQPWLAMSFPQNISPWALLNSPGSGENMSPWLAVLEGVSRLQGSNQSQNETPSSVRMQSGGEPEPAILTGTRHWPPGYLTRPEPRILGLCSATRDDQDFFMKRSKVIFHLQEQKIRIIVQGTNSAIWTWLALEDVFNLLGSLYRCLNISILVDPFIFVLLNFLKNHGGKWFSFKKTKTSSSSCKKNDSLLHPKLAYKNVKQSLKEISIQSCSWWHSSQ